MRTLKSVTLPCMICGAPVMYSGRKGLEQARTGRGYCCEEHKKEYKRQVSSRTATRTNRKYASERMTKRNPMRRAETRAKVSETLRAIGHKPLVQGGNGRGPTVPQKMLAEETGLDMEVIVKTGSGARALGLPPHYKLDLGCRAILLAVEIDGASHGLLERQSQDKKKEIFLSTLGWTVLRFSNAEVMGNLSACAQTVLSTISRLRANTITSRTGA